MDLAAKIERMIRSKRLSDLDSDLKITLSEIDLRKAYDLRSRPKA